MLLTRALLPLSAVFLMGAALAAPSGDMPKCRPAGAMFSPEQRLMMLADAKKATADGSMDMQDYRALQRDKIKAMTPDQRQAYFADLTKRWKALSPAEQKSLKDEDEKRRQEREAKGGGMGGPNGGGMREEWSKLLPCPPKG